MDGHTEGAVRFDIAMCVTNKDSLLPLTLLKAAQFTEHVKNLLITCIFITSLYYTTVTNFWFYIISSNYRSTLKRSCTSAVLCV